MTEKLLPEMITGVKFTISGFFDGMDCVAINREGATGAICFFHMPRFRTDDWFYFRRYSRAQWNRLMDKLFNKVHVQDWKHKYINNDILDGAQWKLSLRLSSGKKYDIYGSNEYPDGFDELIRMHRYYSGKHAGFDRSEIRRLSGLFKNDYEVKRALEEYVGSI